ncbi:unnamed protein product [Rotaria sordida]|uniref:NAD(P)(+)--arginine ADP-ribosyltransferase n=1 Tax=Rotaria sordida TaxID=392033 RepID=A0A815BWJ0_9BILA|nr:unnamed protein product [Rotaria sordida]
MAYTCPSSNFFNLLNRNLAELGSDFRFVSTQALINSGYVDNEPPQGLGQYIFASIIINHPRFRPYQYAGTTFRGMKITKKDLEEYNSGNIVMTRSFLSTSKNRSIAELFLDCEDYETYPPVICIYKVINPRSSLAIENMSKIKDEEEVLIVPFTVFQVKEQRDTQLIHKDQPYPVKEIELEECAQKINLLVNCSYSLKSENLSMYSSFVRKHVLNTLSEHVITLNMEKISCYIYSFFFYSLQILDITLVTAAQLSNRYITNQLLLNKAISKYF